jgi:hypothetical protein
MNDRKFYVTTFCNFAHDVETGRPIGHECYILNTRVLREEADHGAEAALALLALGLPIHNGRMVRGRSSKGGK